MVYLSISCSRQINDKTTAKLALSTRQATGQLRLFTDQNLLRKVSSFVSTELALDALELLLDHLVVDLGRETDSEALAVSLSHLCCNLSE